MNTACPTCDASYEVPESVLAARRPLRCARCGHDWVPGDANPAPAPAVSEPSAPIEAVTVAPILEPEPDLEPALEREDEYDAFVAAEEPETITTSDAALAVELVDEPATEAAFAAAAPAQPPASPFVPPRPIAPRPSLPAAPPAPMQPRVAWGASLAALAATAAALMIFRAPITHAWPPMERFYGLFGM
jgi:predicted Zn finger-like uncharacterized protein